MIPPPLGAWGVVERKAKSEGAGARASGPSGGDGVGHGGVWLGWETTAERQRQE
jgi:hypothetical protein